MNIGSGSARRKALFLFISVPLIISAACSGSSSSDSPNGTATAFPSPENSLSVLLMARDIEVGDARIPIVVFLADETGTRLDDRQSDLAFSYRHADDESYGLLPGVNWRPWPVRGGAYTGTPEFSKAGIWEFRVSFDDGDSERAGSAFLQVAEDSSAPGVGDVAPITVTKTASNVEEVRQISSAFDPDPRFYEISLDEALKNGRPTAVLFSTPAFCVTQTCGPQLDTLGQLRDQHSDDMDFIHVEIFDNIREMLDTGDSSIGKVATPVEDWGLITEPWTFFVDKDGVVAARFEQFTTFDELSAAAETVLAAS